MLLPLASLFGRHSIETSIVNTWQIFHVGGSNHDARHRIRSQDGDSTALMERHDQFWDLAAKVLEGLAPDTMVTVHAFSFRKGMNLSPVQRVMDLLNQKSRAKLEMTLIGDEVCWVPEEAGVELHGFEVPSHKDGIRLHDRLFSDWGFPPLGKVLLTLMDDTTLPMY